MDRSLPYFESVTASSIFKSFVLTTSDVESKEVRSLRNDELFNEKVHMARCCALVMDDRVSGFRRCLNAAFHGSTVIEATGKRRMRYCRTHNIKHAECVTLYHKYTKQTNEGVDLKNADDASLRIAEEAFKNCYVSRSTCKLLFFCKEEAGTYWDESHEAHLKKILDSWEEVKNVIDDRKAQGDNKPSQVKPKTLITNQRVYTVDTGEIRDPRMLLENFYQKSKQQQETNKNCPPRRKKPKTNRKSQQPAAGDVADDELKVLNDIIESEKKALTNVVGTYLEKAKALPTEVETIRLKVRNLTARFVEVFRQTIESENEFVKDEMTDDKLMGHYAFIAKLANNLADLAPLVREAIADYAVFLVSQGELIDSIREFFLGGKIPRVPWCQCESCKSPDYFSFWDLYFCQWDNITSNLDTIKDRVLLQEKCLQLSLVSYTIALIDVTELKHLVLWSQLTSKYLCLILSRSCHYNKLTGILHSKKKHNPSCPKARQTVLLDHNYTKLGIILHNTGSTLTYFLETAKENKMFDFLDSNRDTLLQQTSSLAASYMSIKQITKNPSTIPIGMTKNTLISEINRIPAPPINNTAVILPSLSSSGAIKPTYNTNVFNDHLHGITDLLFRISTKLIDSSR